MPEGQTAREALGAALRKTYAEQSGYSHDDATDADRCACRQIPLSRAHLREPFTTCAADGIAGLDDALADTHFQKIYLREPAVPAEHVGVAFVTGKNGGRVRQVAEAFDALAGGWSSPHTTR